MTETNFRALCKELLQELCCCYKPWELKEGSYSDAMKRANAALAQPKPVAPTDEDLEDLAEVMNVSGNPVPVMRRALELWGNSQGILDSSPQAEPVAPTETTTEELLRLARETH
jgi:hypothetical protein